MPKWKDIEGYNGAYKVSSDGVIKSVSRYDNYKGGVKLYKGRTLKHGTTKGYKQVVLCKNSIRETKTVHSIVANAFLNKPNGKFEINHINGIKADNRVENLEWVTRKQNIIHAVQNELLKRKLSSFDVQAIKKLHLSGNSQTKIASQFNINQCQVSRIVNNHRWGHLNSLARADLQ